MKKINSVIALFIGSFSILAYASPQYNADQLAQFETTNKCSGCDLSSAYISPNHSGAILDNANLSGIASNNYNLNFSLANLQHANLSGAMLMLANFSQADLTGANFAGAMLRGANFYGAKGVNLTNAADTCDIISPDGTVLHCD